MAGHVVNLHRINNNNFRLIKTCGAGLLLSVTRILRAALAKFLVYVCMYVCVTTTPKPLNRFA